jgi:hypothetical protein
MQLTIGSNIISKQLRTEAVVESIKEGTVRAVSKENSNVVFVIKENSWQDKWDLIKN